MDNIGSELPNDIRLFMPIFLLKKLETHPLTNILYPVSLGKIEQSNTVTIQQKHTDSHWLIYCHNGSGKLQYKNKSRQLSRGDLVIIEPNYAFEFIGTNQISNKSFQSLEPSSISNSSADEKNNLNHEITTKEMTIYWVNFSGNLADDFAQRLLMKMDDGLANVGLQPSIINDFDNLLALGKRGYTATNVIHAVHVFQQTLSFLALQLRLRAFNRSSKLNIDAIEELMRNNIHQELSLETLAEYAQLSKFHFAKKFKELADTSPIQHFINMKIQYACSKLDNSNIAIKLIASDLGYNDPYYFSRLFKKIVGLSPKQYRDSRHSKNS